MSLSHTIQPQCTKLSIPSWYSFPWFLKSIYLLLSSFQSSFTSIDMDRRIGRNSSGQSQNGPTWKNANILRVIFNIIENQQKLTELIRQGLMASRKKQRPGNISDFRRLQPAIFTGEERPLDSEQWLIDITNPLKVARVPEENQVEVARIQLKNVARTWWLAEEERLDQPIT